MAENTAKKTKKITIRKLEGVTAKAKVFGLNGVMYTVPYNVETEVPVGIAEIHERSEHYEKLAEREQERIAAEAKKKVNE